MSTTPQPPATATRLANDVIAETGVTKSRLEVLFTGQDPELLDTLIKLLDPMEDAELGIIGGSGPGRDDKPTGKTLADAGLGEVLNKFGSGHQILVKLAAIALALHMYNLLTGVTEGLTPGNAKRRDLREKVEAAFGSGDSGALQQVLSLFGDGTDVKAVLAEIVADRRRDTAPRSASRPSGNGTDAALAVATS